MYRESPTAVRHRKEEKTGLFARMCNTAFLAVYFTFLPILLTIVLNWAVYSFAYESFYQERWMMPLLILGAAFLGGALMRQKMEDETGGLGHFALGIAALGAFAWLTHVDIATTGGVYSRWMPNPLRPSVEDWLLMLPAVGMVGMLFYKVFTLKHYS